METAKGAKGTQRTPRFRRTPTPIVPFAPPSRSLRFLVLRAGKDYWMTTAADFQLLFSLDSSTWL
jgi:hypothetical protein